MRWPGTTKSTTCSSAATVGVFSWNRRACDAHADRSASDQFHGDIIALVSLIVRARWTTSPASATTKGSREEIVYPHDLLEPILNETYGIFVYQEQVMQAQILAGYSLGGADMLTPRHGQRRSRRRWTLVETFVRAAPSITASKPAKGNEAVRPDRQVRRLWLQQVARGGLRCSPIRLHG